MQIQEFMISTVDWKEHLMRRVFHFACVQGWLCGLVWKKKHSTQNPSCTMPSHHCLELPCGSVPASPLLQLFWLQSRPRHSLLSPLTRSKQTDNDQVSRVSTFSRLCLRCPHPPPPPHKLPWLHKAEARGHFVISKKKKKKKLRNNTGTCVLNASGFSRPTRLSLPKRPSWRVNTVQTGLHVFHYFTKTPPHGFKAAVGGKRDRQIYRIDFMRLTCGKKERRK